MKSIELFAGAGGLGIGISRAGFSPECVIEWDRYCCDTLRENKARDVAPLRDWPLYEGDVRDVNFEKYEGNLSLISGGPPCQPFSLGGKHRAHRDDRDMWPQAVRAIREARPLAFIFENVKGLARSSFASYLSYIRLQLQYPDCELKSQEKWIDHLARLERRHTSSAFRGLIYNVTFRVLNAANYGIPQRRERIFFVGFRADLSVNWSFPPETHSLDALLWEMFRTPEYWERHRVSDRHRKIAARFRDRAFGLLYKPHATAWRTVRDVIGDLPDPEQFPEEAKRYANHHFQFGARSYAGHTGSPLDEPAKTLKAGVHGVPGGENMLIRPDGSMRYFTVRESARLQTFPDEFLFHGSWTETMRQLGNAVPVDLAEIVARSVRAKLPGKPRRVNV